jgi:hypothetical protein
MPTVAVKVASNALGAQKKAAAAGCVAAAAAQRLAARNTEGERRLSDVRNGAALIIEVARRALPISLTLRARVGVRETVVVAATYSVPGGSDVMTDR